MATVTSRQTVAELGSTMQSIAVARRIVIGRPRIGMAVRRAEIPWPTARLALSNGRAVIWLATEAEEPA